jgi:hypothetical protein
VHHPEGTTGVAWDWGHPGSWLKVREFTRKHCRKSAQGRGEIPTHSTRLKKASEKCTLALASRYFNHHKRQSTKNNFPNHRQPPLGNWLLPPITLRLE